MRAYIASLRAELLAYKNASIKDRIILLKKCDANLGHYKFKDLEQVRWLIDFFKVWVSCATLLNYAKILHAIEHQDYFEILSDFYLMPLDPILSEYVEFGSPVLMRLKKPLHEFTPEIYHRFRAHQKDYLAQFGKQDLFHLDELDIEHPPANQLFPVQIQMMGALNNQAVDRVHLSKDGRFNLVTHYGKIFLPGGGMLESGFRYSRAFVLQKILQEYIEEEQANFYRIAQDDINLISRTVFQNGLKNYARWHKQIFCEDMLPADILFLIMYDLDADLRQYSHVQKQGELRHLRASIQWTVFKMLPLYSKAMDFLHQQPPIQRIPMFLDVRALGGFQLSNTLILPDMSLEYWFSQRLGMYLTEFGDDLSGACAKSLSFIEVLYQYQNCRYAHLLILLAAVIFNINRGALDLSVIGQQQDFLLITQRLQGDIKHFICQSLVEYP